MAQLRVRLDAAWTFFHPDLGENLRRTNKKHLCNVHGL